ncbi:unnamed protein product [Parnassius apollo]|uniref:(apollo) hypothetical protein n=1 Tax=Parnassius apollo TaxID=110799 RepID=A0A8S3WRQ5_PARAO|nr:unnamed protein product [Parnassius apollo]
MHGVGEYFWRYIDREGAFVSYEGHFYCNQMHGYGTMSYADGRVFEGLFHSNLRWGPGVESHISVRENVGLWLGNQLIRLCWRPSTHGLFLDFMATSTGRACVEAERALMTSYTEPINKNTVMELLVEYGLDQQSAEEKWMKLHPKHCSDVSSPVFPLQLFEDYYYGSENKNILQEIKKCGDQTEIIHFLVEAGAGIDNYNDSCCTALGVALIRFICARKNISANDMTQASLETVSEWNLVRDVSSKNVLMKNSSKIIKSMSSRKLKSLTSLKDIPPPKMDSDIFEKLEQDSISEKENINKSIELFIEINNKYETKTAELYSAKSTRNPISYIFEVQNITNEFESIVEEPKKNSDKNPKRVNSKAIKESVKPTNGIKRQSNEYTESKNYTNSCEQIMLTITQLLSVGADPRLVRCPQPALFMAIASGCSNLVQHLIDHGVNVNEICFHLTNLLRCGADPLKASQNDETQFENIFVFAKKTLDELEHLEIKQNSPSGSNKENKVKKNGKNVDDKVAKQKTLVSDIEDYKQTVELMTDWARLLHIRWLRAKFVKESIKTIIKFLATGNDFITLAEDLEILEN